MRKYSATDFEGLEPRVTVQVASPPLSRIHQEQVERLTRDARALLRPPDRSPLHLPFLRNGSRFSGKQTSHVSNPHNSGADIPMEYNVTVDIKEVDLNQDYLSGYLTIKNLTENYPTLTTFFEAEILGEGSRHNFRTGNRWRCSPLVDQEYWGKFPAFHDLLADQGITLHPDEPNDLTQIRPLNHLTSKGIFMRWKEWFLVPDHRIQRIEGASYDGFYYMYYDKTRRSFDGYYYHDFRPGSNQFQRIELEYSEQPYSSYSAFR